MNFIDGGFAVAVTLEKNLLAIGRKDRGNLGGVAGVVLAQRQFAAGQAQHDQNIWSGLVLAGSHEYRRIGVATEVGVLAGTGNQLVGVLIRGAFADRVQLSGIVGKVQIEDGAAVRRPASRADSATGERQLAILRAVEVYEPQSFVTLAIENLGSLGARLRMGQDERAFGHGSSCAFLQSD